MTARTYLPVWLLSASLLGSLSSPATASYFGLGVGSAQYDIRPLLGTERVEEGAPFTLFVGNRGRNLGFELGLSGSQFDWKNYGGQASHHVSSAVFAGIAYTPMNPIVSLYGKLGLNFWSTTVDYLGSEYNGDDGVSPALGAGMDIAFAPSISFRFEYLYTLDVGDGVDKGNISMFTASGVFYFGR